MPRGGGGGFGGVGFRGGVGGGFLHEPPSRRAIGPSGAGGSAPAEDLTGSEGHSLVRMMSTAGGDGTFRVGGRRWLLAVQRIGGGGDPAEGFVYVGLRRVDDPGACWPASVLEGAGMPEYGRIAEPLCSRLSESRACIDELVRRGEGGKSARLMAGGLGATTTMSPYMMG